MKQRIGDRYEFDRATDIIGRGGMGTVYKGTDTVTGQVVAIKQLKPDVIEENPDFVERFTREAEALRRLNHPNIVSALDTISDDNNSYLIMEYVSGGSLWDEMQNTKPMPIGRVLQIALDLCDALTRAHRLKIIHRDLKPANVLIAEDGTPRLTDFGVAQIQDKTRVTRTGAMIGTLNYLSPEALNGDPIDERSDIWAFGIMLYEMLAGRSPFPDENTTALITSILTKPLPDLTIFRPEVSPSLVNLVGNMLVKDPEDRIDSIRKVGSELEDIIRHDSKGDLSSEVKRQIIIHRENRFDTPTPTSPPLLSISKPVTKPTMGVVKSDTGEEYILVSRNIAKNLWLGVAAVLVIIALGIGVFVATRPNNNAGDVNLIVNTPPNNPNGIQPTPLPNRNGDGQLTQFPEVVEGDYPLLVFPGISATEADFGLQSLLVTEMNDIFRTQIPYAHITAMSVSPQLELQGAGQGSPPSPEQFGRLGNNARGGVILRAKRMDDNRISVIIQLADTSRFPHNPFDRPTLERLLGIEILVATPRDVAPFVAGAYAILNSADGNIFEFVRMMTVLSELPPANGEVVTTGVSTSVYRYFAHFINDEAVALDAIDEAVRRDSGNPLLFAYRSLIYVRQKERERANSDILSAARLAPESWAFPLYIRAVLNPDETILDTANQIITLRPDDWFAYFVGAHGAYTVLNDPALARDYIDDSLANDPYSNQSHLLSALLSVREGKISDAITLLGDMIRRFPNAGLSYRGILITFGESFAQTALIYTTFASLLIGQYEQVIELTNGLPDQPNLYLADLFLFRGISLCAMTRYDEALEAYDIGLEIDPTNHIIHLLRAGVHQQNGDTALALADITQGRGLSDEIDAYIISALNPDAPQRELSQTCSQFFENFTNSGS